jgi:hypothetical protein
MAEVNSEHETTKKRLVFRVFVFRVFVFLFLDGFSDDLPLKRGQTREPIAHPAAAVNGPDLLLRRPPPSPRDNMSRHQDRENHWIEPCPRLRSGQLLAQVVKPAQKPLHGLIEGILVDRQEAEEQITGTHRKSFQGGHSTHTNGCRQEFNSSVKHLDGGIGKARQIGEIRAGFKGLKGQRGG